MITLHYNNTTLQVQEDDSSFRSRTKDVDLNYPQRWYVKAAYSIFGTLVYPFIK